jgi:hypothetical protein
VGIASVNHVDHPRADLYFRRQPARRDFRIGNGQYLLLARSCSVAGLVTSSASKLVVCSRQDGAAQCHCRLIQHFR